ncbi:hypothetical protein QBC38DRAFT_546621 [Podospora fimiseda]|uniref:Uncharacterized protein n=1 Tax=Podospora fimiseda TaxID=252190 RepID=A0AAN7BMI3_9PEZI|nr:hypothetical protein QBC38DRAFT_546621 [Podospora fimiseda]
MSSNNYSQSDQRQANISGMNDSKDNRPTVLTYPDPITNSNTLTSNSQNENSIALGNNTERYKPEEKQPIKDNLVQQIQLDEAEKVDEGRDIASGMIKYEGRKDRDYYHLDGSKCIGLLCPEPLCITRAYHLAYTRSSGRGSLPSSTSSDRYGSGGQKDFRRDASQPTKASLQNTPPFKTHAGPSFVPGSGDKVLGVVPINLNVKRGNKTGKKSKSVLVLNNVLHIPSATVNILGGKATGDYNHVNFNLPDDVHKYVATIEGQARRLAVLVERFTLFVLRTSDFPPPEAPSPFGEGFKGVVLGIWHWPESERKRFEAFKRGDHAEAEDPPYTSEEKQWLKQHWRGEEWFLRSYGFKIHDEDDRAAGRRLVRAFMKRDKGEVEEEEEEEAVNPWASAYSEEDPPYTQAEKKWLRKYVGGEWNFLDMHVLDIKHEPDRASARSVFRRYWKDVEEEEEGEETEISAKRKRIQQNFDEGWTPQQKLVPPYTPKEKIWLKHHFEGEWGFLKSRELRIDDENDRATRRCLLRNLKRDSDKDEAKKVAVHQGTQKRSLEQDEDGDVGSSRMAKRRK